MFVEALIFTGLLLLVLLALAVGVLWWLFAATYGQHAGEGEGVYSVAQVQNRLDEELHVLPTVPAPLALVRPLPTPRVDARQSVWTLPEELAA